MNSKTTIFNKNAVLQDTQEYLTLLIRAERRKAFRKMHKKHWWKFSLSLHFDVYPFSCHCFDWLADMPDDKAALLCGMGLKMKYSILILKINTNNFQDINHPYKSYCHKLPNKYQKSKCIISQNPEQVYSIFIRPIKTIGIGLFGLLWYYGWVGV